MEEDKSENCVVPNGTLLVVGGHEDKGGRVKKEKQEADRSKDVLATFVQLTGKKEPVIEVITSGSSEGEESFKITRRPLMP
ncbi:hypothetical protein [Mucilaginibacter sp. HD30]